MKVKIVFLSIFLVTFVIGYSLVFNDKKVKNDPSAFSVNINKSFRSAEPKPEIKLPPNEEIIEWEDADAEKLTIKLLETGEEFHGDEVEAKTGERWLGLFKENDKYFLKETKLKIKFVNDSIVDKSKNEKTGKSVFTDLKAKSIFLLKNAKLKSGEIKTLYYTEEYDESSNLKNNSERQFEFNGESYTLKIENKFNNEEFLSKGSKLILSKNGTEQILTYVNEGCDDCGWQIYWVGDIDRDGKLDFYFNLTTHYNVTDRRLFLSSQADKGTLVKHVANFVTSGC